MFGIEALTLHNNVFLQYKLKKRPMQTNVVNQVAKFKNGDLR